MSMAPAKEYSQTSTAVHLRRLAAERKGKGLCVRCGKPNPDKGYANCPDCRARHKKTSQKKRKAELETKAVQPPLTCLECGAPLPKDKKVYCNRECQLRHNQRLHGAQYKGKVAPAPKHRCHDCGKPTPDHRCPDCLHKWRMKHGVSGGDL